MKMGFYSIMMVFLLFAVLIISYITYSKVEEGFRENIHGKIRENWSTQSTGGIYDTNYIGGLGWGKGYGDWDGVETGAGLEGDGQVHTDSSWGGKYENTPSGNWTPPGWSVLSGKEPVGGVGIDQVFHKSSFEGELGENLDAPSAKDTQNRLGGGWPWGWKHTTPTPESIIPPSGAQDESYGKINGDLTFYAPGSYMYGADNYVPSYATSVLLSPMLGVNAPLRPVHGEGQGGGMEIAQIHSPCSPDSGASVLDMEAYCQTRSPSEAMHQKCCVALVGDYSMAGNDQGPYNRSIYTNPMIPGKKDWYIHMGKCYGNCPTSYVDTSG